MTEGLDLFSIGSWTIFDHIFKMARYPKNGETVSLDMPIELIGGIHFGDCSANVAAVAARLGLKAGLGMRVGEDFVTSGYRDHLLNLGVDLSGVAIIPGAISGHSFLFFDPNGDGFCLSHLGIAQDQSGWETPTEPILRSQAVVINETFGPYTLEAASLAGSNGKLVIANGMLATGGPLAESFLKKIHVLFISESEARQLLSLLGYDGFTELAQGLDTLFVTRGRRGSQVFSRGTVSEVPAVPAESVVDPTGAGDAYASAAIVALLKGHSELTAARVGATVSSFVVEAWGCQTNMPPWNRIRQRYKEAFGEELIG
jgi:sugar/nucleoside kinase (ribokinase family)